MAFARLLMVLFPTTFAACDACDPNSESGAAPTRPGISAEVDIDPGDVVVVEVTRISQLDACHGLPPTTIHVRWDPQTRRAARSLTGPSGAGAKANPPTYADDVFTYGEVVPGLNLRILRSVDGQGMTLRFTTRDGEQVVACDPVGISDVQCE